MKTFCISWSTFRYKLNRIGPFLAKETMTEDPIFPGEAISIPLHLKQVYFVFFRREEQDCSSFPAIFFRI